jgi:hypothetical protein
MAHLCLSMLYFFSDGLCLVHGMNLLTSAAFDCASFVVFFGFLPFFALSFLHQVTYHPDFQNDRRPIGFPWIVGNSEFIFSAMIECMNFIDVRFLRSLYLL